MQQRVLAFAEPRDWHVNAYLDEHVYTARARPEADLYARVAMVPYEVVGPLSKWLRQDSTKMVLVDPYPQEAPPRMAAAGAWMGDVARGTPSLDWSVGVFNPHAPTTTARMMVAGSL